MKFSLKNAFYGFATTAVMLISQYANAQQKLEPDTIDMKRFNKEKKYRTEMMQKFEKKAQDEAFVNQYFSPEERAAFAKHPHKVLSKIQRLNNQKIDRTDLPLQQAVAIYTEHKSADGNYGYVLSASKVITDYNNNGRFDEEFTSQDVFLIREQKSLNGVLRDKYTLTASSSYEFMASANGVGDENTLNERRIEIESEKTQQAAGRKTPSLIDLPTPAEESKGVVGYKLIPEGDIRPQDKMDRLAAAGAENFYKVLNAAAGKKVLPAKWNEAGNQYVIPNLKKEFHYSVKGVNLGYAGYVDQENAELDEKALSATDDDAVQKKIITKFALGNSAQLLGPDLKKMNDAGMNLVDIDILQQDDVATLRISTNVESKAGNNSNDASYEVVYESRDDLRFDRSELTEKHMRIESSTYQKADKPGAVSAYFQSSSVSVLGNTIKNKSTLDRRIKGISKPELQFSTQLFNWNPASSTMDFKQNGKEVSASPSSIHAVDDQLTNKFFDNVKKISGDKHVPLDKIEYTNPALRKK